MRIRKSNLRRVRGMRRSTLTGSGAALRLALVGATVSLGAMLGATTPYTALESVLEQARQSSPAIQARAHRAAAEEYAGEALPRWYLPDLYAEAGYGLAANRDEHQDGPLARLLAEWTLWDGGRTESAQRRQRLRAELVRLQGRSADLQTRLSLSALYLRAARLEELQLAVAGQIAEFERLRRLLLPRARIGTATRSDVQGAAIRADTLRHENELFAGTSAVLREQLGLLAGMADAAPIAVPPLSALKEPAFELDGPGPESHPDYQLSALTVRLIRAELDALKIDLYRPSVGVGVHAGYGPRLDALEPNRPELGADLRFRFPLYTSRDRTARLETWRSSLAAARLEAQARQLKVRAHLLELRRTLAHNRQALADHRRIEARAAENLRLAYLEFARGQKAPADMHEAIATLFELRRDRIDLRLRSLLGAHELAALAREAQQGYESETSVSDNAN